MITHLVNTLCRSGRMSNIIFLICGSNPMSNMRSASSKTKYETPLRSTISENKSIDDSLHKIHCHDRLEIPTLQQSLA